VRGGLIISVLLHAAVLGWAIFTIQTQREIRMPEPDPIAVDLVTVGELTKLRQGARNAKQLEAQPKEAPKPDIAEKEAPKPAPVATAPPPPPPPPPPPEPPAVKDEPKPEPKKEPDKAAAAPPPEPAMPPPVPAPDEQKKLEEMLKEQERQAQAEESRKLEEDRKRQEAEAKKRDEERRRKEAELKKKREDEKKRKEAEAKKKQFDAAKISALLNKIPDKGAPRPSVPLDEQVKTLNKGPVLGAPEGRDNQLSASELALLAQIIKSCVQSKWNVLAGGESAQNTQVKIRLRFNPDGRLASSPQVMNPQSTPYFLAVQDSALRAVHECEPFPLPAAKYEFWKDIVMNFDPRDMF
jgi:colicin import membrane protein